MRNITLSSRSILSVAAVAAFGFAPLVARAQGALLPECVRENVPGVGCALETLVSISRFLFGIMGSAALLMFVIGGFFIVAAGGRDAWIKKGKEYVKNAVIGVVIILLAGYAIQYGANALRGGQEGVECNGEIYTERVETGNPADPSDDVSIQSCCERPGVVVVGPDGTMTCGSGSGN